MDDFCSKVTEDSITSGRARGSRWGRKWHRKLHCRWLVGGAAVCLDGFCRWMGRRLCLKPFTSEESLKFNGTSPEVQGINVKTRPKRSLGRQEMVEAERQGWFYLFFIYIDHMGRKGTQKKTQNWLEAAQFLHCRKSAGVVYSILSIGKPKD